MYRPIVKTLYFAILKCLIFSLQLERAADGFSVVAEYYGRGVFNKVCFVTHWIHYFRKNHPLRSYQTPLPRNEMLPIAGSSMFFICLE